MQQKSLTTFAVVIIFYLALSAYQKDTPPEMLPFIVLRYKFYTYM